MKYIMFEDFSGTAVPIIFPSRINFDEMREQMPYTTALSAGYITLTDAGVRCHGQSKSLQLEAGPNDAAIIQTKFEDAES